MLASQPVPAKAWRSIELRPWLERAARVPITWTDVFCGGGGSSRGLLMSGQGVNFCVNHSESSIATHQLNHPYIEHDTQKLTVETDYRFMPHTFGLWVSPSCVNQGRASGRKALSREEELRLQHPAAIDRATAWAVVNAAEVHRYEVIAVENVEEFRKWVLFDAWASALDALGYEMTSAVLDAADLGAPQNRRRFMGVFTRNGVRVDLTPPPRPRVPATAILDPHPGPVMTRRRSDYVMGQIEWVAEAGETDTPYLVTYRRNAKPKRADQHQLATITAGGNHHAIATRTREGMRFRMLNNFEKARAQGFPEGYVFCGKNITLGTRKIDQVAQQIGNAVPTVMAAHVADRIAIAHGFESQEPIAA